MLVGLGPTAWFLCALIACGKPAPKEIPNHQVVPSKDQGEFKSGEAFKLVVGPAAGVVAENLTGVTYSWGVEGPCSPQIKASKSASNQAELMVSRVCGPEEMKVTVIARRDKQEKSFMQVFTPKPISRLYGVKPVNPSPRPGTWRVLDDFDASPTTKRTPFETNLGVWNFDGAKCSFGPGPDKGVLRFKIKLAGAKSACGLFMNLAENEKGEPVAGSVEGAKKVTAVVRSQEKEVPFVLEFTEFDSYASYNQGATVRSKSFLASPDGWHRHEVRLKALLKSMDFGSIRQLGIAVDRKAMGDKEGVIDLDVMALIKG